MRQAKRILALLLILVLGLSLYPAAAMADPPEDGEATHKHSWQITYQRQASCEEDGIIVWTCSLCGKNYSEYPPTLGHDWDNGTVTRPADGFTPEEVTYTCKRDASHTLVREINPVSSIFAPLLGFTPPTLYSNTLRITLQPEGGRIARGFEESHTMTVAAEGGEGGYTYVWHYTDNGGAVSTNALDTSLLATINGSKTDYSSAMADFYAAMGPLLESQGHGDWMSTVSPSVDPGPDLLGWRESGTLDCKEPSYTATVGNCGYYCVVWDSAGHHATSNTVRVEYRLSIRTQPKNTNLPAGGEAELICQAGDGTGNYTYTWMKAGGGTAEGTSKEPGHFTVTETGDYYCVVSDGEESIESQPATVYEAEDLVPVDWSKDVVKWPEDSAELFAEFEGGTPPYHCQWTRNGEIVKEEDSNTLHFTLTVEDHWGYYCKVTDAMDQKASAFVYAGIRELKIAKQPEGGMLGENGRFELSVEMAEGKPPFTYTLRYIGSNGQHYEVYSGPENSREITLPTRYYFHIEDADGHTVSSDLAIVEDRHFRIKDQSHSAVITDSTVGTRIFVEAEGGKEPYHYYWYVFRDADLLHDADVYQVPGNDSPELFAKTPGKYFCIAEDSSGYVNSGIWYSEGGVSVASDWIDVSYEGDAPCIVLQPYDVLFDYSEESQSWALCCDAIPGKGGNEDDLLFEWYFKAPGCTGFNKLGGEDRNKVKMLTDINYPGCNGYSPTRNCGWYYCKVTDPHTGKSTDSRIATVDVGMMVEDAFLVGRGSTVKLDLVFYLAGGYAPYDYQIYVWWTKNDGEFGEPILYRTGHFSKGYVSPSVRTWHDYTYEKDGVLHTGRAPSLYFLVITDALGQRYEYYHDRLCVDNNRYWLWYKDSPYQTGTKNDYYFYFNPTA